MDGKLLLRLVLFFLVVGFAQFSFIRSLWKTCDLGAAGKRSDQNHTEQKDLIR
jgi:hypothetical protein